MKTVLFFASMAILFSCNQADQQAATQVTFDIGPVKKHIAEMNKIYADRFTKNDSLFYVQNYCLDAQVMSPGVPVVKGREAIQNFFYGDGNNKGTVIELPDGNIYGSADLIVEESSYNFPDGKGGSIDKGKFIALWKQEDGRWKLFREIWNSDNPPPASK